MLLFVMDAEGDERFDLRCGVVGEEIGNVAVHVGAVVHNLLLRRPGEKSSAGAIRVFANLFVVGVEDPDEVFIERLVYRQMRTQQECLEEPGGMCEMPFDRASVGHGLKHLVFGAERRGKCEGGGANGLQMTQQ
ncbi:MAG: hypothetical protein NVS9B15_03500 [Acidobacteriaceae bacterium]